MTTREELEALPTVGKRIARVIKDAGLNQTSFAKEIETTREQVNRWTRDRGQPGPEWAAKIAAFADQPAELFNDPAADLTALLVTALERVGEVLGEVRGLRSSVEGLREDLAPSTKGKPRARRGN